MTWWSKARRWIRVARWAWGELERRYEQATGDWPVHPPSIPFGVARPKTHSLMCETCGYTTVAVPWAPLIHCPVCARWKRTVVLRVKEIDRATTGRLGS